MGNSLTQVINNPDLLDSYNQIQNLPNTINLQELTISQSDCLQMFGNNDQIKQIAKQLQNVNTKKIDQFEIHIFLILISKIPLEEKVSHIFQLFDSKIGLKELVLIGQSCLSSLNKIKQLPFPSFKELFSICRSVFVHMGKTLDEYLYEIEIVDYIKSSQEFSTFFLSNFYVQSIENLLRTQKIYYESFLAVYQKSIGLRKKYVLIKILQQNLELGLSLFSNIELQYFIKTLTTLQSKQSQSYDINCLYINQVNYNFVAKAFSIFKADDLHQQGRVPFQHFVYMIQALTNSHKQYTKNQQFLSIREWIHFSCVNVETSFECQIDFFMIGEQRREKIQKFVSKLSKDREKQQNLIEYAYK